MMIQLAILISRMSGWIESCYSKSTFPTVRKSRCVDICSVPLLHALCTHMFKKTTFFPEGHFLTETIKKKVQEEDRKERAGGLSFSQLLPASSRVRETSS